MHRAFEDALAAGVPERFLRSEQEDWLDIREDAARYSREAVASVYRQRIDELRVMGRHERRDPGESTYP